MNVRFTVQYEGTHYQGWQRQGNTDRTIQGRLEALFAKYYAITPDIRGSGRTDSGVHALGQVMNLEVPYRTPEQLAEDLLALNSYLPPDIRLVDAASVAPRFHSRLWATWKHYRYTFAEGIHHPLHRRFETALDAPVDLELMRAGGAALVGTHDFGGISDHKHKKKSAVRTLHQLDVTAHTRPGGRMIVIDVYGDGFLYHQVRYIAGVLAQLGMGTLRPTDVSRFLDPDDVARATWLTPPDGLVLMQVAYTPWEPTEG